MQREPMSFVGVRMPSSMLAALDAEAEALAAAGPYEITRSAVIRHACQRYLAQVRAVQPVARQRKRRAA